MAKYNVYTQDELTYMLYQKYILPNPELVNDTRFFLKSEGGTKYLNSTAIKNHVIAIGQHDTLKALDNWSKTGQLLIQKSVNKK